MTCQTLEAFRYQVIAAAEGGLSRGIEPGFLQLFATPYTVETLLRVIRDVIAEAD